jgi:hypothetical protein
MENSGGPDYSGYTPLEIEARGIDSYGSIRLVDREYFYTRASTSLDRRNFPLFEVIDDREDQSGSAHFVAMATTRNGRVVPLEVSPEVIARHFQHYYTPYDTAASGSAAGAHFRHGERHYVDTGVRDEHGFPLFEQVDNMQDRRRIGRFVVAANTPDGRVIPLEASPEVIARVLERRRPPFDLEAMGGGSSAPLANTPAPPQPAATPSVSSGSSVAPQQRAPRREVLGQASGPYRGRGRGGGRGSGR